MKTVSPNIDKLIRIAKKDGIVTSDGKLLKSSLAKMYSKSSMHKQVENVVCKIITDFENVNFNQELKK